MTHGWLLLLLALSQVADVVTTRRSLRSLRGREANPFVARLGLVWFVSVKVAVVACGAVALAHEAVWTVWLCAVVACVASAQNDAIARGRRSLWRA